MNRPIQKVFIFDLDDMLMDNVHDYAEPILDATRLIIRTLGVKAPHVSQIIAMEQEIDKRRVNETNPATGKPFLYSMTRFPGSLVETYREICERAKVDPKLRVEKELYEIGLRAFDEMRHFEKLVDGENPVISVLKSLRENGCILMLLTKGDPEVQEKKIEALKLHLHYCCGNGEWFRKISIVESAKTLEVFLEMLVGYDPKNTLVIAVGNDYDKDIAPALQLKNFRVRGIFIPVETWEMIGKIGEIMARVDKERCIVLENISQIPANCAMLELE